MLKEQSLLKVLFVSFRNRMIQIRNRDVIFKVVLNVENKSRAFNAVIILLFNGNSDMSVSAPHLSFDLHLVW